MDIAGIKVTVGGGSEPLPVGSYVFEEPAMRVVVSSSSGSGAGKQWYIHVDVIDYVAASCRERGLSEEAVRGECFRQYVHALSTLDIDSFEAELFWQAYEDSKEVEDNPYNFDV